MLTIVLLDVRMLKILWVLDVVESPAQGLEAIRIVRKLCSVSCVDDIPCIHNGVGYLFPVVPTVVVAVWLRPRGLIYWWLATPGVMVALVLKKRLMYDLMASPDSCLHIARACRVATRCRDPWKLSMKTFLRSSHECMDSCVRLSSHVRGAGSRAIGK